MPIIKIEAKITVSFTLKSWIAIFKDSHRFFVKRSPGYAKRSGFWGTVDYYINYPAAYLKFQILQIIHYKRMVKMMYQENERKSTPKFDVYSN